MRGWEREGGVANSRHESMTHDNLHIKICGLTRFADARLAADLGAWALGFIFYDRSPRYVRPEVAAKIVQGLPRDIEKVGVFVDAPRAEIEKISKQVGLTRLQFHGDESPAFCAEWELPVIKAVRLGDQGDVNEAVRFGSKVRWLAEPKIEGQFGGTGKRVDAKLFQALQTHGPVILAGGLNPQNVAAAVRDLQPWGVDASSGLESSPGVKDEAKLRAFFAALGRAH